MNMLFAERPPAVRNTLSTSIASALALVLAACSDATSSAAAAASATAKATNTKMVAAPIPMPPACSLISEIEATTLLAQEANRMEDSPENCLFVSAGSPGKITMLMVQPMQLGSVAEAESMFDTLVNGLDGLNKMINDVTKERTKKSGVVIDGLGDAGWRSDSNVGLVTTQRLVARKGTRILVVNITGMAKANGLGERMEAYAKIAVAKL
jgi:glucose/arabinose dehydrogenase